MKDYLTLKLGIPFNLSSELISYDGTIQARLKECEITNIQVDLIDTWRLEMRVPYYIIEGITKNQIINPNYNLVTFEKLIRLKINGSYAVFVVKEITEDDNGYFKEITAYSLERNISKEIYLEKQEMQLQADAVQTGEGIFDFMHKKLRGWKLVYLDEFAKVEQVNGIISNKYRYFDGVQMQWSEFLKGGLLEAYDILLLYDTDKREIYCYDYGKYGQDTGFKISKKNIINEVGKATDTKELITKLFVTGKDGLTMENACPYGNFVLNYNGVKALMSDNLQIAIGNYDIRINELFNKWKALYNQTLTLISDINNLKSQKDQLDTRIKQMQQQQAFLITEQGKEADISSTKTTKDGYISQRNTVVGQLTSKENQLKTLQTNMNNISISMQPENITYNSNKIFNNSLLDELDAYTKESRMENEYCFRAESLYDWANKKIEDISKPEVSFNIKADNFLDDLMGKYKDFHQEISIGDWFVLSDEKMGDTKVRFIGYTYNPSARELVLKFSNKDKRNEFKGINRSIKKFGKTSNIVTKKKINWDLASQQGDFVRQIREDGLIEALGSVLSEHNKNKIQIDENGIWMTNAYNENEMMVLTANALVISDDGLNTVKTCINSNGLIGDTIIGRILAGENLYISNKNNNFIIDQNGIRIDVEKLIIRASNGDKTVAGMIDFSANALTTSFTDLNNQTNSRITQTADRITSDVNDLRSDTHTQINQLSDEILLKASRSNLISEINICPEGIKIDTDKLDITGLVTFHDLSNEGSTTINGSNITTGYINADRIDGGTINGDLIKGGTIRGTKLYGSDFEAGDVDCQQLHVRGTAELYQGCTVNQGLNVHDGSLGVEGNIHADGKISCNGEKTCIQSTEHFGKIKFFSYETGENYLADKGFGFLKNGQCRIDIDPRIQESLNLDGQYFVRLDKYGKGDIWTEEIYPEYFIIKGENDIKFSWTIEGKRRGFEDRRLNLAEVV